MRIEIPGDYVPIESTPGGSSIKEGEIEEALWCQLWGVGGRTIQQYKMGNAGRLDLLHVTKMGDRRVYTVIELKRGEIQRDAVIQLLGYMGALSQRLREKYGGEREGDGWFVVGRLVGTGISPEAARSIAASPLHGLVTYTHVVHGVSFNDKSAASMQFRTGVYNKLTPTARRQRAEMPF